MDKIDLIIDVLESWQYNCLELGRCSSELGLATKALAAARSLRELKPVAWMLPEYGDVLSASEADGTGIYNVPLYTAPQKYCPSENNAAYEKGVVEGMAKQMHSSVDRAVNTMAKPWVGLTGTEINHSFAANVGYPERMCRAIEAKLKEKNEH